MLIVVAYAARISGTVRLDDFEQLQSQHTIRTLQFLRESWQPAIKKSVQSCLREVDPERWDAPPPPPASFLDPDEQEAMLQMSPTSPRAVRPTTDDLLAASLLSSGGVDGAAVLGSEFERPDTRSFRLMRGVNYRMSDAIRLMAQESLRAYVEFMSHSFARRTMLTDPTFLPYIPLFSLDVQCEDGDLSFSDDPEAFVEVG